MKRIFATLAVVLLLPLSLVASAQSHMHMKGMANEPALGASAAFAPDGRLWLVTAKDGHVLVQYSDDFGKTLSTPIKVNPVAQKIYDEGENRPKIALGPQGQIYVSWSHPLAEPYTGYVRFARSLDGGKHFSKPITVNHDLAPITHRFDALVVAGNGDVVIAWIDGRNEVAAKAKGKSFFGKSAYYTWSSDEGKTFKPDHEVMEHSCECCRIALARKPDGDIGMFFRGVYGNNIRDHAFAVLNTNGKDAHPERATFSDWQIAACPHHGPGLAIGSNGVLHGVWYEASHGSSIWYGQLDPDHPPKHLLKIGGPGASHADVAVHGDNVWVVWNQISAKGYRMMERSSNDSGTTFSAPHALAESTVAVYSPELLVHDGRAYVAWNTADGFRLIALHGTLARAP